MTIYGFAATVISVRARDTLLVGFAEATSDAIPVPGPPSWPRASVMLRRSVCTSTDSASRHRFNVF